ncbi:MAG: tetratricopeptide repeat protein, partial [Gemmatimonadetes bacterium]|nr:tetratricopeptide repeat protein [Gemmatimonadota bacterium]
MQRFHLPAFPPFVRTAGFAFLATALLLAAAFPPPAEGQVERNGPVRRTPASDAFERGDYPQAARLYEEMLAEDPDNWQAAFRIALSWHRAGDYERSVEAHRVAARFPEAVGTCHFNMACALARLGRTDESLA